MESIPEEPGPLGDDKRVYENKTIEKKHFKDSEIKKDFINCSFLNCSFTGVIFKTLVKTTFEKCEFTKCVFYKDLKNVSFHQCKHTETNFTKITLTDCFFMRTGLIQTSVLFSTFDNCTFEDGEFSSPETKQSKFLNCKFTRYNVLNETKMTHSTFTGTEFNHLMVYESSFHSTSFKNCSFTTVNQRQCCFNVCDFPYSSVLKSTFSDNKFLRCNYSHFSIKHSNILRNSFQGSTMDHVLFERSVFSYNNLSEGKFYNLTFTFCTTRENKKKDAVFCNSEMLTSTQLAVTAHFKDNFEHREAYTYCLKLFSQTGSELPYLERFITVQEKAPSVAFLVSYDLLNQSSVLQVSKHSTSTFGGLFTFSANQEQVIKYITINEKCYMVGVKVINGNKISGFISDIEPKKRFRSKSL